MHAHACMHAYTLGNISGGVEPPPHAAYIPCCTAVVGAPDEHRLLGELSPTYMHRPMPPYIHRYMLRPPY